MKVKNIFAVMFMSIILLSCASSSSVESNNKTSIKLQSGYDKIPDVKDNIVLKIEKASCILETSVNGEDKKSIQVDDEDIVDYIREKFVDSKLFTVINNETKGNLSNNIDMVVKVAPKIKFWINTLYKDYQIRAQVTLNYTFTDAVDGVESTKNHVRKLSDEQKIPSRTRDYRIDKVVEKFAKTHISQAFERACSEMSKVLSKNFNVSSHVIKFNNTNKNNITIVLDKGSQWGYDRKDQFVIYIVRDGGEKTKVAVAKADNVSEYDSTLRITDWNEKDEYVKNELKPSLIENGLQGYDLRAAQMIH